jgi:hypothetical protein
MYAPTELERTFPCPLQKPDKVPTGAVSLLGIAEGARCGFLIGFVIQSRIRRSRVCHQESSSGFCDAGKQDAPYSKTALIGRGKLLSTLALTRSCVRLAACASAHSSAIIGSNCRLASSYGTNPSTKANTCGGISLPDIMMTITPGIARLISKATSHPSATSMS